MPLLTYDSFLLNVRITIGCCLAWGGVTSRNVGQKIPGEWRTPIEKPLQNIHLPQSTFLYDSVLQPQYTRKYCKNSRITHFCQLFQFRFSINDCPQYLRKFVSSWRSPCQLPFVSSSIIHHFRKFHQALLPLLQHVLAHGFGLRKIVKRSPPGGLR